MLNLQPQFYKHTVGSSSYGVRSVSYRPAIKAADLHKGKGMGSLHIEPHLSIAQIKERLYSCKSGRYAFYWQIILTLSLSSGKKVNDYAALLGCSERKLYRIRALYNKEGPPFTEKRCWGGRRERRCLINFEEEQQLLQSWEVPALKGGVLVAKQLRQAVEQKIGRKVSDDYLWDLLHRHGWTKKAPLSQKQKKRLGTDLTM